MLNYPLPREVPSKHFVNSYYLREWIRYMHVNLDAIPLQENKDPEDWYTGVSKEFRRNWVEGKHWFDRYTKMDEHNLGEGINTALYPDVTTQSWANLSRDWKLLICQAGHLGSLHRSSQELPNTRSVYFHMRLFYSIMSNPGKILQLEWLPLPYSRHVQLDSILINQNQLRRQVGHGQQPHILRRYGCTWLI